MPDQVDTATSPGSELRGPFYAELTCRTAEDLLELLNPFSGPFIAGMHLYRGVEASAYGLTPSVMRKLGDLQQLFGDDPFTHNAMIVQEAHLLQRFLEAAEDQGIHLSDNLVALRQFIDKVTLSKDVPINVFHEWPHVNFLDNLAMAQHNGLSTRLLDWTFNPFHACLFACPKKNFEVATDFIAIWVYRGQALDLSRLEDRIKLEEPGMHMFKPSYRNNLNIVMQKGALLFHRPAPGSLNSKLDHPQDYFGLFPENQYFTRILMPNDQANNLKNILSRIGITWSSLFPGLAGAASDAANQYYSKGHSAKGSTERDLDRRIARGQETLKKLFEEERVIVSLNESRRSLLIPPA